MGYRLFFQMDGGLVTPIRELVQHKSYIIAHVGRSLIGGRYHIILKLWGEFPQGGGRHLYIILPRTYEALFTPELTPDINTGTLHLQLVLLGFTPRGMPILQFPCANIPG